jgi:hypothetical protein
MAFYNMEMCNNMLEQDLKAQFKEKILGSITHILGMDVYHKTMINMYISQRRYEMGISSHKSYP